MVNTPSPKGKAARPRKAGITKQGPAEPRRAAAPVPERRRATPIEQLATEVLSAKDALDGAMAQFGARVSGQLAEVLTAIAGPEPPAKRTVKEMIVKVREVKLKPERGKIKDLARLQRLADDLVDMLSEH
jgi:hypothetical protein